MHHGLLVLRAIKFEPLCTSQFGQALAQAADISVAKDAPEPLNEAVTFAIALQILVGDESDEGLSSGKPSYTIDRATSLEKSLRPGCDKFG